MNATTDLRSAASPIAQHAARLQRMLDAALHPEQADAASASPTHLHVRINGVMQALDIATVQEVVHPAHITPLRGAPPHVRGLMQVRGVIVPIVDPARVAFDADVRVVLVEHRGSRVGVLVEAVIGLGAVDAGIDVFEVDRWVHSPGEAQQ